MEWPNAKRAPIRLCFGIADGTTKLYSEGTNQRNNTSDPGHSGSVLCCLSGFMVTDHLQLMMDYLLNNDQHHPYGTMVSTFLLFSFSLLNQNDAAFGFLANLTVQDAADAKLSNDIPSSEFAAEGADYLPEHFYAIIERYLMQVVTVHSVYCLGEDSLHHKNDGESEASLELIGTCLLTWLKEEMQINCLVGGEVDDPTKETFLVEDAEQLTHQQRHLKEKIFTFELN
ncbi:unnamed protein product [Echinostoma caproni]|uniref:PCIF1_WW domain-containing protein n=1 Tax=Echinostoma caproni TaxID=27848 RepID=A0A183B4V6_9TREM|nr:unnamed protein product [Echinostoma caproni]